MVCLQAEEIPMTMQVGMLGSNGVVLASDTKCSRDSLSFDGIGADDSYGCSKIRIDKSHQIAVTCARDMALANKVAEAFMVGLKEVTQEDSIQMLIREIGCDAMGADKSRDIECLIGLTKPFPLLYKFQYVRNGTEIIADRVITFAHTGHATNAAIFWSLRHYKKESIANLMPLAALLVTDAAVINSARIGGLEVVLGDERGFHRISLVENERIEEQAKIRSRRIAEQVMQPFSASSNAL